VKPKCFLEKIEVKLVEFLTKLRKNKEMIKVLILEMRKELLLWIFQIFNGLHKNGLKHIMLVNMIP
jgi:hypothetical protein